MAIRPIDVPRNWIWTRFARPGTTCGVSQGRWGIAVLLGTVGQDCRHFYNDVLVINEKGKVLGRYTKTWRAGEH